MIFKGEVLFNKLYDHDIHYTRYNLELDN